MIIDLKVAFNGVACTISLDSHKLVNSTLPMQAYRAGNSPHHYLRNALTLVLGGMEWTFRGMEFLPLE
jgi:hypothetical protein